MQLSILKYQSPGPDRYSQTGSNADQNTLPNGRWLFMNNESWRNPEAKIANFQDSGASQKTEEFMGDFMNENARKREPANDEARVDGPDCGVWN